jgi:hypothetical protein
MTSEKPRMTPSVLSAALNVVPLLRASMARSLSKLGAVEMTQ